MSSPIDGSRMLPSLAARAAHSPATITSPAAVAAGDREQRRAKKLTLGRRVSADISAGAAAGVGGHTRRVSGGPVAPSERTPLLAPPGSRQAPPAPSAGAGTRPQAAQGTQAGARPQPQAAQPTPAANGSYGTTDDPECHSDALAVRRASVMSQGKGRYHGLPGMNLAPTVVNEFRVLVASSVPLSAGLMLENALNTINILVCGRLGATELAVAGNSSLLIMVTGEYFVCLTGWC